MKNKKLFAILTLVCFMFTLMPVAAFAADNYAEVDKNTRIVEVGDNIKVNITGADSKVNTNEYYVFAEKDGAVSKKLSFTNVFEAVTATSINFSISEKGTYNVFVVDKTDRAEKIVAQYEAATIDAEEAAAMLKAESDVTMLTNTVVVKAGAATYAIEFFKDDAVTSLPNLSLAANDSFGETKIYAKLTSGGKAVVGEELTVGTNSSAITATPAEGKTNGAGLLEITVTGAIAGDYELYVKYGSKEDATLDVKVTNMNPANITTVVEPTAPVALDSAVDYNLDVYFTITDANGNNVTTPNTLGSSACKVVVTEKPATSKIDEDAITLTLGANGWGFAGTEELDEEGTYTFKVVLANGNYATATVEVKEFQTPVELQLVYPTNAVEVGGEIAPKSIKFVDANGVTKDATSDVKVSATGYAISSFDYDGADKGTVKVKNEERYVGTTITVVALNTKYNVTDSVELVVANEAAAVKYASNTADVAVNNTLTANIVDQDGNKVALNGVVATGTAIQYIVLEQPENSKVAISTKGTGDLFTKGQFKVSFTASAIGTYKVQTIVTYDYNGVTKYYSGIEEIVVGNTGFDNIVVFSIGSNEVIVNNEIKTIEVAPYISNGRTMVQYRTIGEAFGADVAYDEATQSVTAELNGTTVVMTIGSATYTINGVEKTADVAPYVENGRTIVPVKFIVEAFGIIPTYTTNADGTVADVLFAK